jgi:hypothetical protein
MVPIKSTLTRSASPVSNFLGIIAGGIVDKVIHITSDVQGLLREIWMSGNEEAWIMGALLESHVEEMSLEVVKPMPR